MRRFALPSFGLCLAWIFAVPVLADVRPHALFSDNMVLQRDQALPIWGTAEKGEEITVKIADQTVTTKAGEDGKWKVTLQKLKVGDPLEMIVKGSSGDEIKVKNATGQILQRRSKPHTLTIHDIDQVFAQLGTHAAGLLPPCRLPQLAAHHGIGGGTHQAVGRTIRFQKAAIR